jgi:hypothetical protein
MDVFSIHLQSNKEKSNVRREQGLWMGSGGLGHGWRLGWGGEEGATKPPPHTHRGRSTTTRDKEVPMGQVAEVERVSESHATFH